MHWIRLMDTLFGGQRADRIGSLSHRLAWYARSVLEDFDMYISTHLAGVQIVR